MIPLLIAATIAAAALVLLGFFAALRGVALKKRTTAAAISTGIGSRVSETGAVPTYVGESSRSCGVDGEAESYLPKDGFIVSVIVGEEVVRYPALARTIALARAEGSFAPALLTDLEMPRLRWALEQLPGELRDNVTSVSCRMLPLGLNGPVPSDLVDPNLIAMVDEWLATVQRGSLPGVAVIHVSTDPVAAELAQKVLDRLQLAYPQIDTYVDLTLSRLGHQRRQLPAIRTLLECARGVMVSAEIDKASLLGKVVFGAGVCAPTWSCDRPILGCGGHSMPCSRSQ